MFYAGDEFVSDAEGTTEETEHSHECRDCGAEIECYGDEINCWAGGNDGCPECEESK